jgi:hypothetical protein
MSDLRDACVAQIQRLDGLLGFPKSTRAIKALVDALEDSVTTGYQAGKVIEAFDEADRCPRPATIRRTAWEMFPPKRRGIGCELCVTEQYLPDGDVNPEHNLAPRGFIRLSTECHGAVTMCRCHPGRLSEQPRGRDA